MLPVYKHPCYCFCVSCGRSMFFRLVWLSSSTTLHLIFQVRLSVNLELTVWLHKLASKLQGSSWLPSQCRHYCHVPPHSFFFFNGKWVLGTQNSNLWCKHTANWCTPCPVPFTIAFKSLLFSFHSAEWDMTHETMLHYIFERRQSVALGAGRMVCARHWNLASCQKIGRRERVERGKQEENNSKMWLYPSFVFL